MRTKTFEMLGREADQARTNVARARAHLTETGNRLGEAGMIALVDVKITGANWDNGMLAFQEYVRAVIADRLVDILPEALGRMEAASMTAMDEMRAAAMLANDTAGEVPPRQVPRPADVDPVLDDEDGEGDDEGGAPDEFPEAAQVKAVLSRQALELLSWVKANPSQTLAKNAIRDELSSRALVVSKGRTPNATWSIEPLGLAVLMVP